MATFYKQRTDFEKNLLGELTPLLKGTGWKKSRSALINQSEDFFQAIYVSAHRNDAKTTAVLRLKPMAIDPIFWDVFDLPENKKEPISFRAWGAFTCTGIPILEGQLEQVGSSTRDVASALLHFCTANSARYREALASCSYSELVEEHPHQVERGAYAVTLVCSLINEQNYDRARQVARSYATNELSSCSDLLNQGRSFHSLALEWLDARQE